MRRPIVGAWSLEFIDPQRAEQLFRDRANNRTVNTRRLRLYKQHMLDGTWTITHQGICLDVRDRLNDGQHRVLAISETGIGQWMWVYREPSEASGMQHFDKHQERSTHDTFKLAGITTTKTHVAVARAILADGKFLGTNAIESDDRVLACMEHNRDRMAKLDSVMGKTKGYGGAAFSALMCRAMDKLPDRAQEILRFVAVVMSGVADGAQESAAIRYRDLAAGIPGGGQAVRHELYYKGTTALLAFLERRSVAKLYESSKDVFAGCAIPRRESR